MKKHLLSVMSLLLGSAVAQGAQIGDDRIEFQLDKAIYAGSGCLNSASVSLDDFGDLQIEYGAFSIDLYSEHRRAALADRKVCIVRVPAKIPLGFYVKSIQQTVLLDVRKSAGADLEVVSLATFDSIPVEALDVRFSRRDVIDDSTMMLSQISDLALTGRDYYCQRDASSVRVGMFQLNVAQSAQRANSRQEVASRIIGQRFGQGIEIELASCNE